MGKIRSIIIIIFMPLWEAAELFWLQIIIVIIIWYVLSSGSSLNY